MLTPISNDEAALDLQCGERREDAFYESRAVDLKLHGELRQL